MVKTFKDKVEALLTQGQMVSRPCDEYYLHEDGQKLQRCTNYLRIGQPFVMGAEWQGSTLIGTDADQLVRDAFVNGIKSLNSYDYRHLTQPAFEELKRDTARLISNLKGNWTVYADRVFLFSKEMGVAGEVDLLLVNYDTEEVLIVDMKTIRTPSSMSSKTKKYGQQLNTYRIMAEEMMGGHPVKGLYILPVKVTYPKYGQVTSTGYMMPWIEVPIYDTSTEIDKKWKEKHGMTAREYFDWTLALQPTQTNTSTNNTPDWWNEVMNNG